MWGDDMSEKSKSVVPPMFLGTVPFDEMGNYYFRRLRVVMAVSKAIQLGYGVDCAVAYGNHYQVGNGIKASGKKREDIFVTSKLFNTQQDNHVKEHYCNALQELDTPYLDLLLLHWPQTSTYINAWKQMEELYQTKLVCYIGMANVELRHLERIEKSCCIMPHVVQIERHPLNIQKEVVEYCTKKGIIVQAYAPLGVMDKRLLNASVLMDMSARYNKTIPQIILRWQYQTGVVPVVRSIRKKRIISNYDIWDFEIKEEDIEAINALNIGYKHYDPRRYVRYY